MGPVVPNSVRKLPNEMAPVEGKTMLYDFVRIFFSAGIEMSIPSMTPSIRITRFELYPTTEPMGYVVGFTAEYHMSNRYFERLVELAETTNKTDEEIAALAWTTLQPQYETWFLDVRSKSPIVGSVWQPSSIVNTTFEPPPEVPVDVTPTDANVVTTDAPVV